MRHRSSPRPLAALLAAAVGLIAVPALASAPATPVAAEAEQPKQVAAVKVEIRQESGKVIKGSTQLEWNEDGSLSIEEDGTKHKVKLRLEREGKSKKVNVTVAYTRGGEDIIAPYEFSAKMKKREVLRIEGNLAIAVTITPKKLAPPKQKDDKPKLDVGGDPDDPLSGLD